MKAFYCLFITFVMFSQAGAYAVEPAEIQHLQRVANSFPGAGISFKAAVKGYDLDRGTKKVEKQTYSASVDVLLDAKRGSRIKADYRPMMRAWSGGAAEYFTEFVTIAFNGEFWAKAIGDAGPRGETSSYRKAELSSQPPEGWRDILVDTGEAFLLSHALILERISLSDILKSPGAYKVEHRQLGGSNVEFIISANVPQPCSKEIIVIDIAKDGALVKRSSEFNLCSEKGIQVRIEYVVEASTQIDGTTWLPSKASRLYYENDVLQARYDFDATEFKVHSKVSKEMFDISLLPGWSVSDKMLGIRYKIGNDMQRLPEGDRQQLKK